MSPIWLVWEVKELIYGPREWKEDVLLYTEKGLPYKRQSDNKQQKNLESKKRRKE